MKTNKEEEFKDLGFGTKVTGNSRLINKNGRFTVERKGQNFFKSLHIYDRLINLSWFSFLILVISSYTILNFFFASVYYLIGPGKLLGIVANNNKERFLECFYFSAQTITTVGYGRISPIGSLSSSIASLESLIGLLGFAIATGLLYGRFSKARADVMYSNVGVIATYREMSGLMFRIASEKNTQLIELEVSIALVRTFIKNGQKSREFLNLKLERSKINFLALSWTIVHPLDDESPLKNYNAQKMAEENVEFLVLLKAFHDSFGQTVYSRTSYTFDEINWGEKFSPVVSINDEGTPILEIDKLSLTETV